MEANPNDTPAQQRLTLRMTNAAVSPMHIKVEPWAREYDLSPRRSLEFVFTGPDPADVEIEVMPREITVFGWTGSVLDGIGLPVPPTPPRSGDIPAR